MSTASHHDCPSCTTLAAVTEVLIDADMDDRAARIAALEQLDDIAAAAPLARLKRRHPAEAVYKIAFAQSVKSLNSLCDLLRRGAPLTVIQHEVADADATIQSLNELISQAGLKVDPTIQGGVSECRNPPPNKG
jgi:hypothetical protein